MNFYYNNVPGEGLCRNNLIYTSLINDSKTVFEQWFYNDSDYHKGKNEVVDPRLMKEKFDREVKYLLEMQTMYAQHVPEIVEINYAKQKITYKIQGDDFWEQAGCLEENYTKVLPNWQEQMLEILEAYKSIGVYKYSIHPSSYFVVDGKLKSINHFFCYDNNDKNITVESVLSHISYNRRKKLFPIMEKMGIPLNSPAPYSTLQVLALESFRSNFPDEFINKAIEIYA